MCGICGIVCPDPASIPDREMLFRMSDVMRHRGPDDEGTLALEGVGFGHRRLSIIDLSSQGRQPMANEDESLWVVHNGEIYNYRELRGELEKAGHRFRSQTDTEVILHAYEEWGENCVERFRGMWAFALWDVRTRSLFASRDRFGIKPFYHALSGRGFLFASEIKSLLASGLVEARPDPAGLADYLTFQYVIGDGTLFSGVRRLPPASNMVVSPGGIRVWRYWDIDPTRKRPRMTENDAVAEFEAGIEEAVRSHLCADVPVGAHLSGGLDTASVACFAARHLPGPLETFTGFCSASGVYDDRTEARRTATRLGTAHHEIEIREEEFFEAFRRLAWVMDEPAAGEGLVPQYFVSRLASERVKVVLGGQGADEILGGYTRHYLLYRDEVVRRGQGGGLPLSVLDVEGAADQATRYAGLAQVLEKAGPAASLADRHLLMIRRGPGFREMLNDEFVSALEGYDPIESFRRAFNDCPEDTELLDRILLYETRHSLPSLLQVEDRASMAVSLESRVPLLDHRLAEFLFTVPTPIRFRGGRLKYLLREVLRHKIPREIVERRDKIGFPVPLQAWTRRQCPDWVSAIRRTAGRFFRPESIDRLADPSREFDRTLWGVMNVCQWSELFLS